MVDALTKGLMSYEDALARILDTPARMPAETVPLEYAENRVLASDVTALLDQPPHSVSAMDGYAVKAEDIENAGSVLKIVGRIAAGDRPGLSIENGQAARIFTGAPVPDGADAIVIQENATETADGFVRIEAAVRPGAYVRPAAYDFQHGAVIAHKGQILSSAGLSLAAAAGHAVLPVIRRPRVAIISTGNELVAPGAQPEPGQIIASNAVGVAALLRRFGAEPIDLGIARDSMDSLLGLISRAQDLAVDVLVTLGGASVGDHDLVRPALEKQGAILNFWKVAVRPGKPLMHGQLGSMIMVGLPGNPVSSLVCTHIFIQPLIRRLMDQDPQLESDVARLASDLPANGPRRHFMRGRLVRNEDGTLLVAAIKDQDSSLLAQLSQSDVLINVPPNDPGMRSGQNCEIIRLK